MDENINNPQNQEPEEEKQQPSNPEEQQPQSQEPKPTPEPASEINKASKQWATICHLTAFAGIIGIPLGNILGPLIVWLIKKEEMAYVNSQGKRALNFQISMTIYGLATFLLMCLPPLAIVWGFAVVAVDVVFVIIAAIKASEGKDYKYPLSIEFLK